MLSKALVCVHIHSYLHSSARRPVWPSAASLDACARVKRNFTQVFHATYGVLYKFLLKGKSLDKQVSGLWAAAAVVANESR